VTVTDPEALEVDEVLAVTLVDATEPVLVEKNNTALVWSASPVLAAIMALNTPPDTVYEVPERLDPFIGPVYTSQYTPAGSDVVKEVNQAESSLLITTKPIDPINPQ
jgi:hypothetical protein